MTSNQQWNLESFVDSFILELDKAQDTLAVKGVTRKLTYTVKDVALDLQIFPIYEGGKIRFVTAQPGEAGSSRLSLQLGSITNRQIAETTKEPISKDDIAIDVITDLDEEVRDSLRKVGVNSASDLERLQRRNVDVEKVVKEKTGVDKPINYADLANLINKAKRRQLAPKVSSASLTRSTDQHQLDLHGDNLALSQSVNGFPLAVVNDQPVAVTMATDRQLRLMIPDRALHSGANQLKVALDPYAVIALEVNA